MTIEALEISEPTSVPAAAPAADSGGGLFAGRLALAIVAGGLLVIGLGWYGISGDGALIEGKTDLRAQLPYLISGGFLGLGLIILGSALLVAHTTRVERARGDALMEVRFDSLIAALGGARLAVAPEGFVVAGAAAYHRADCRLAGSGQNVDYVSVEAAEDSGLRPCRNCLG